MPIKLLIGAVNLRVGSRDLDKAKSRESTPATKTLATVRPVKDWQLGGNLPGFPAYLRCREGPLGDTRYFVDMTRLLQSYRSWLPSFGNLGG